MIIAVPIEKSTRKSFLSQSFARASYFGVYDSENETFHVLDNPYAKGQSGVGVKAVELLRNHDVNHVIAYRIGTKAKQVIDAANITVSNPIDGSCIENIETFLEDKQ